MFLFIESFWSHLPQGELNQSQESLKMQLTHLDEAWKLTLFCRSKMHWMKIYIGCFQKIWENPQIIHFNRVWNHYKPSILGYHYFWKQPYRWSIIGIDSVDKKHPFVAVRRSVTDRIQCLFDLFCWSSYLMNLDYFGIVVYRWRFFGPTHALFWIFRFVVGYPKSPHLSGGSGANRQGNRRIGWKKEAAQVASDDPMRLVVSNVVVWMWACHWKVWSQLSHK